MGYRRAWAYGTACSISTLTCCGENLSFPLTTWSAISWSDMPSGIMSDTLVYRHSYLDPMQAVFDDITNRDAGFD